VRISGYMEGRGEPIPNPVTGAKHRVRIDSPEGFEYVLAEVGRGWSKTTAPIRVRPTHHSTSSPSGNGATPTGCDGRGFARSRA
jgi:hypothetical protein